MKCEAENVAGTARGNWAASFLSLEIFFFFFGEGATRAESVNAARWMSPAVFTTVDQHMNSAPIWLRIKLYDRSVQVDTS